MLRVIATLMLLSIAWKLYARLVKSICLFEDSDFIYNYNHDSRVFDKIQTFGDIKLGENLKAILVQFASKSIATFDEHLVTILILVRFVLLIARLL